MATWLETVFPLLWITLRTIGFMITAPILGTRYVPGLIKATVSLLTGYILWPLVSAIESPTTLAGFMYSALGEVTFGLILGFSGTVIMAAIETAGYIVDMKIGFGMANVVDPHYGQTSPIFGTFKYLLIILIFLTMNGHHMLLKALFRSFELIPAGAAFVPTQWAKLGLDAISLMLRIAVVLSSPVWVATLIVDFSLGVIARTVPQLNVFVVGIPIKTLIGLGILSGSLTFYGVFTKEIARYVYDLSETLMEVMSR